MAKRPRKIEPRISRPHWTDHVAANAWAAFALLGLWFVADSELVRTTLERITHKEWLLAFTWATLVVASVLSFSPWFHDWLSDGSAPAKNSGCERISPEEFESQKSENTRSQLQRLFKSREYKSLIR